MPRLVVPELLAWPARCRWPAWSITGTLPELLHLVPLQVCQALRRPMACRCWPPVRSRRGRRQVLADLLAWPAHCRWPAWLITGPLPELLHLVLAELLRLANTVPAAGLVDYRHAARAACVPKLSPVKTGTGDRIENCGDNKIVTRQPLRLSVPVSPLSPSQNTQSRNFSDLQQTLSLNGEAMGKAFDSIRQGLVEAIRHARGQQSRRRHARSATLGSSVPLELIVATIARMHSKRFSRPVIVTRHAAQRMADRGVSDVLLLQIIDDGGIRYRDDAHLWAWLDVPGRDDNLVCAVLVLEDAVIVKTVMHRWELMP